MDKSIYRSGFRMNIGELLLLKNVLLKCPTVRRAFMSGKKLTDKQHIHLMVFFENWALHHQVKIFIYGALIKFFKTNKIF
jgi:hypothetical protein